MTNIASKLAKREARAQKRAENVRFMASVACEVAPGASNGRSIAPDAPKRAKGRIKRRKGKRKSLSNSKLEAIRWEAFAAVIRERDADRGCISCGGAVESAGHGVSRRRTATKYDERNVNGQCLHCNWKDKFIPGYHDVCIAALIYRHGSQAHLELVEKSKETLQESRQEILSSAWGYIQRMSEGERKEKLRAKLSPLVPVAYGGTMEEKERA